MERRTAWIVRVTVLAVLALLMTGATALALPGDPEEPYTSNTDCLYCHEDQTRLDATGEGMTPASDFNVGPVDRTTACPQCHLDSLAGTHPYHYNGANCGAVCHNDDGWGESLLSHTPSYVTTAGAFATIASKDTSSSLIHLIHQNPRWPADFDSPEQKCGSCHSNASCDVCHADVGNPIDSSMATHSDTDGANDPWDGVMAYGAPGGDMTQDTAANVSLQCGTAGCHDIPALSSASALLLDDFSHSAYPEWDYGDNSGLIKTGTWRVSRNSLYTAGQMSYSNALDSEITASFTGEQVMIVSDLDPYRGEAEVLIDGNPVGTIDTYAATSKIQSVVFTSDVLAYGPHTVSLRILNTKNGSSRATYVAIDQFRFYAHTFEEFVGNCNDCHGGYENNHDGSAGFTHIASQTAGTYAGFTCTSCHDLNMKTEHSRASAVTQASGCNACHEVYAPLSWTDTYDGTCAYGTCHVSPRDAHSFTASDHTLSNLSADLACEGCHEDPVTHGQAPGPAYDLADMHNNTLATNGWDTDCLTCHASDTYPTTKSCTDASCHAASGVTSMAGHPYFPSNHIASDSPTSTAPNTGGYACSYCHDLELKPEHQDKVSSAGVTTCPDCHDVSYFPVPWDPKTCTPCHDAGDGQQAHAGYTAEHGIYETNSGATCGGADCHDDTGSLDPAAIHAPTASNCSACHPNTGVVPTETTCNDAACHPSGAYHPALGTAHASTQTACTDCHTTYADIQNHVAGCAVCHDEPKGAANANLSQPMVGNYTTTCTDCHVAGVLGTTYLPTDPAHYSAVLHAPTNTTQADDTSYNSVACGDCHDMVLSPEHDLTTSAKSVDADVCVNCHATSDSATAVGNDWSAKNTTGACAACHGVGTIDSAHNGNFTTLHTVTSTGCGSTGAGCHNTSDLSAVGADKTTAIHDACLRCHDRTASGGNLAYDPTNTTCGNGRDCHATGYDTSTFAHGTTDGDDATYHTASGMASTVGTGANNSCADCHSSTLEAAHPAGITGNLGWSAPMCNDCHDDVAPVDSVTVIKTNSWSTKTCDECHVTHGGGKHSRFNDTDHAGVLDGTNNCDASCHSSYTTFNLVDIHDGTLNGCQTTDCHAQNTEMTSAEKTCGEDSTGCHQDKNDGNHGSATAHPFTVGADYSQAVDNDGAGCTNSGSGCHGTDALREDYSISQYHASGSVSCLTSDCHTSGSKAGYAEDGDCQTCHDSTYLLAQDTVELYDIGSAGHYNETTHTASGTNMSATMDSGGSASAACSDCHDPVNAGGADGLFWQHKNIQTTNYANTRVTCYDCHNDVLSYGAAEVVADWTNNQCEDCHKVGGSTQMHNGSTAPVTNGTSTLGCGSTGINCHSTLDLHVLHADAAGGCDLSGCHDFALQANVPSDKSCGTGDTCHNTYTNTTHAHASDNTLHAPTNTTQADDTSYYSTACGACHEVLANGVSLTNEHAMSTSAKSTDANNCLNCHNNAGSSTAIVANWSSKNTTSACAQCHDDSGIQLAHNGNFTTLHSPAAAGCANSGSGCHPTANIAEIGAPTTSNNIHSTCLRCHDRTAAGDNLAYDPASTTCGNTRDCHNSGYDTGTHVHGTTDGDDALHLATGMSTDIGQGSAVALCSTCHSTTLDNAHTGTTGWGDNCTSCHNSVVITGADDIVKADWTNDLCSDCHTGGFAYHDAIASHTGAGAQGCGTSGAGCHNSNDLRTLHETRVDGCTLSGCHDSADKDMGSAAKGCGSGETCHNTYTASSHGTATGDDTTFHEASGMSTTVDSGTNNTCADCHTSTLENAHDSGITGNLSWSAPMCDDCHNDTTPVNSVAVIKTNSWSTKLCDECHVTEGPGKHSRFALATHSGTLDGTNNCDASCHPMFTTFNLADIHDASATGCAATGCHSEDTQMTTADKQCGEDGSGCHLDRNDANHGTPDHLADAAVGTLIDGGPDQYDVGTNVGCFGCHDPALHIEHGDSTWTSGAMDRTMDNGGQDCDVCHDNDKSAGSQGSDATESTIQNAITAGDMRCATCHNDTEANGTTAPHQSVRADSEVDTYNDVLAEFEPRYTTGGTSHSGGHRSSANSPAWPLDYANTDIVNGVDPGPTNFLATYTGTNPRTTLTWAAGDMVYCEDCHWYTSDPSGPQGATVPLYIAGPPADADGVKYTGDPPVITPGTHWYEVQQSNYADTMCNRCHDSLSSAVHTNAHRDYECQCCHVRIPHAWKRPRLMVRTVGGEIDGVAEDAVPYADPTWVDPNDDGRMTGYEILAGQDDMSAKANCNTSCGNHDGGLQTSDYYWP